MDSERLAELADRLDIRELLDRYSHAVDFMDWRIRDTVSPCTRGPIRCPETTPRPAPRVRERVGKAARLTASG